VKCVWGNSDSPTPGQYLKSKINKNNFGKNKRKNKWKKEKLGKLKKKNLKKKKKKKGKSKKKKGRITVDYCCNPQWNVCGGTVIPHTV
jgi:hypothetical protein